MEYQRDRCGHRELARPILVVVALFSMGCSSRFIAHTPHPSKPISENTPSKDSKEARHQIIDGIHVFGELMPEDVRRMMKFVAENYERKLESPFTLIAVHENGTISIRSVPSSHTEEVLINIEPDGSFRVIESYIVRS